MAERFPRNAAESNPVILVLARVAAALEERERAALDRRRTMAIVDGGKRGDQAR